MTDREALIRQMAEEYGYMPCSDKDCPFCLRGLQRKCPQQDARDCAIEFGHAVAARVEQETREQCAKIVETVEIQQGDQYGEYCGLSPDRDSLAAAIRASTAKETR